jgi:molybdopterin converting factor subunit 1
MRIQLLLFAVHRELTGVHELAVEAPDGVDAAGVLAMLRAGDIRFAQLPEKPAVAVNREYVPLHTRLRDGDELALIPPVAGG